MHLDSVFFGDVVQHPARGEVRHDGTASFAQHEFCGQRQRILFPDGRSGLRYDGQTVRVRVVGKADVRALLLYHIAQFSQVFRNRLRGMRKKTGGRAVKRNHLTAQSLQEQRTGRAPSAVHAVQDDLEFPLSDAIHLNDVQREDPVYVPGDGVLALFDAAQAVPRRFFGAISGVDFQQFASFPVVQKGSARAHEFQAVPLDGIMTGCDGDAARGPLFPDRKEHRGRRHDPQVYHVRAHGFQTGQDRPVQHRARRSRIPPHDDRSFAAPRSERRSEAADLLRIEAAAHDAPNARHADD